MDVSRGFIDIPDLYGNAGEKALALARAIDGNRGIDLTDDVQLEIDRLVTPNRLTLDLLLHSLVQWSGRTSHDQPSSAYALGLPDAACSLPPTEGVVGSPGFRAKYLDTCSGSSTARGSLTPHHPGAIDVAFRYLNSVGTPDVYTFAAQFPAHASPCQRFTGNLAVNGA